MSPLVRAAPTLGSRRSKLCYDATRSNLPADATLFPIPRILAAEALRVVGLSAW